MRLSLRLLVMAWNEMLTFLEENLKHDSAQSIPGPVLAYEAPFVWRYYLALAYEHALGVTSHLH